MNSNGKKCVLALLILMSLCESKAKASDYEVNQFRQTMNAVKQYALQASSDPYASPQQQQAIQSENQYEAMAEQIINSPNAMRGYGASQIESILREFDLDYSSATYASVIQKAYDVARKSAAAGLQTQAIYELQNAASYDIAVQICVDADNKSAAAQYASVIQNTFNAIRTQGWSIAAQKLRQYSNNLQDFRQAEALFVSFQQQAAQAQYASLKQGFYNSSSTVLSARELALFTNQSYQMDYNTLNAIVTEYGNKYSAAPYASMSQQLFGSIRDAARNRLSGMQPPRPQPFPPAPFPSQPFPPAPPMPFPPGPPHVGPQGVCDIRPGANAFGQTVYRVETQTGAIFGPFNSYQEAQNYEMHEPQCGNSPDHGPGFDPNHGFGRH